MECLFFFPPESAFFTFDAVFYKVVFTICTLTWRVNNYVFRQAKVLNRRIESTTLEFIKIREPFGRL